MRAPSLKSADFHRALGTRPLARTAHFFLHALYREQPARAEGLAAPASTASKPASLAPSPAEPVTHTKLSTASDPDVALAVDDCAPTDAPRWRLGLVLPKKQARRSVTRSLLRHQAREAFRRHAPAVLAAGRHGPEVDGWVVRLRAPFDRQQFPSAASDALSAAVRQELDELWSRLGGHRA